MGADSGSKGSGPSVSGFCESALGSEGPGGLDSFRFLAMPRAHMFEAGIETREAAGVVAAEALASAGSCAERSKALDHIMGGGGIWFGVGGWVAACRPGVSRKMSLAPSGIQGKGGCRVVVLSAGSSCVR